MPIRFTSAPPDDPRGNGLPLMRTHRTRPTIAVVTCQNVLGCNTHFWGGRTVPCDATDCEACSNGAPWRWHGYVSAFDHRTRLHFLFETTARAAEPFKEWFEKYGTLRGAKFEAVRHQQRANGRVNIRLKSVDAIEFPIPAEPNILAALAIIWNIPLPDFYEAEPIKGHEAIGADRGTAEAAAALAANLDQKRKTDVTMLATAKGIESDRAELLKRARARRAAAVAAAARTTAAGEEPMATPFRDDFARVLSTSPGGNGRLKLAEEPASDPGDDQT